MLLDKHALADKLNTGKVAVGYDLGSSVSQISYCFMHKEDPETVSTVAGEERYHIPTVLCKRLESNQWLYGKDALMAAENGEGILISDLLELAYKGIPVVVEEDEFDPVSLLALFVKKSLSLLQLIVPYEKIQVFMLTVRSLDPRMVEVLSRVAQALELKTNKVYLESYKESFYYYTIHQPADLWLRDVLVCDYSEEYLRVDRLEMNPKTKPIVAYVEEIEYEQMRQPEFREDGVPEKEADKLDKDFLAIIEEVCDGRFVSAAYLIGNGFQGDWSKESLRALCKGRRVFQGNNLYSKGACYAAREKLIPSDAAKKRVFLGDDKLKANIGMRVVRRGEDSYLALLDAGISWYESVKEVEFLLESGNSFTLTVTPLNGRETRNIEIELTDLPKRPDMTTRLSLTIRMLSEKKVKVTVKDMGFGDLFRSSGACFEEEFEL
ncbi:MAG: hypothetical protein IJ485_01225 [Lachnospiraceae bacterium]|nr:hypothetical protein [Lachnospiraceae bacterium]